MALLAEPPGLPSLLEGFLNLRGAAVPVLRLGRLFGLPAPEAGLHSHLLVLRSAPHPLALLVDSASEIASLPADAFLPVREGNCFNECAAAEVTAGGRVVHLLAADRLLLEKERRCVSELQARAQQYLDELEACRA